MASDSSQPNPPVKATAVRPEPTILSLLLSSKTQKQASAAVSAQSMNTLPTLAMMSKAEQRRVNRLPKASEEEESRTEDIRRKLGSLGRREFSVVSAMVAGHQPMSKLDLRTNATPLKHSTGSRLYDSVRRVGEQLTQRAMIDVDYEQSSPGMILPMFRPPPVLSVANQVNCNSSSETITIAAKSPLINISHTVIPTRPRPTPLDVHFKTRAQTINTLREQPPTTMHRVKHDAYPSMSKLANYRSNLTSSCFRLKMMQDVSRTLAVKVAKPSVQAALRPSLLERGGQLLREQVKSFETVSARRRFSRWHMIAVEMTRERKSRASTILWRTAQRWLASVELRERIILRASQIDRERRAVMRFVGTRELLVVSMQGFIRGGNTRRLLRQQSCLNTASYVVQRGVRCHSARVTLVKLRFEYTQGAAAAVFLQRRVRGKRGRKRYCAVLAAERASKISAFIQRRVFMRRKQFRINGAAIIIQERWRKRMRMRRHHFREERLRVRKANTIRRAISRFNARAKRRHRRAAGKDVRLPGIL